MKEIIIDRLYKGLIDIRHYILNDCYKKNMDIKITVKDLDGYMILKPKEFKEKTVNISKNLFKSKFNGHSYKLVSFKWIPENN